MATDETRDRNVAFRRPDSVHEVCGVRWCGRQAIVALPDYLDLSNADAAREELLWTINLGAVRLIADLSQTATCDYAGAEALARACKRAAAAGTELVIVASSPLTLRTLTVFGLDRRVPVYDCVETAEAAGRRAARPARTPADSVTARPLCRGRQSLQLSPLQPSPLQLSPLQLSLRR